MQTSPRVLRCALTLSAAGLVSGTVGCGDNGVATVDQPPTITVLGVADGEAREGPVTITISVDRGTFVAELNGTSFFSGRTVSAPDDYLLTVTARNGEATSTRELAFSIILSGDTRLIIRVFDLGANESGGGGDAILLTDSSAAGMRHAMVDAGPAGLGGSDAAFVSRRLAALGVDTLDALILTHAHTDHFGGMGPLLSRIVVRRFFYNGQVRTLASYNTVIADANRWADTVEIPAGITEMSLGFGTARSMLTVVSPLATFLANTNADGSQINEGSLGTEVSKGSFRMYLTGDGEVRANARWRSQFSTRTASLTALKVGHHGANDATFDNGFNGTSAWLVLTAPELAVISANGVTHPRRNAINFLLSLPGTRTYCTNVHGDIEIRVADAGAFAVKVQRNPTALCTPGTDASS